jgi:peptidoglycan/xylan/chitin deacetylase (PgdA/CDA1 family)
MPVFYFRNDDVNVLDPELVAVSRRCTDEGVSITHTVEPANVTDEAAAWLLEEKLKLGRLVEIMQHGYDHRLRDLGEFGGSRPYEDQFEDLKRGKEILIEKFGNDFLPILNFPFGPYNQASMRAADRLGFRVVSSHYNHRQSRRLMYTVGHALKLGQILGKHVSWHLDFYPRTGMFSVDMAASFIDRYIGEHGSITCDFHPLEAMKANIEAFIPYTPVIGVLLHHRFHHYPESLDLITDTIRHLKMIPDAEFLNIEEIYERYCPDPGKGFRDA